MLCLLENWNQQISPRLNRISTLYMLFVIALIKVAQRKERDMVWSHLITLRYTKKLFIWWDSCKVIQTFQILCNFNRFWLPLTFNVFSGQNSMPYKPGDIIWVYTKNACLTWFIFLKIFFDIQIPIITLHNPNRKLLTFICKQYTILSCDFLNYI